MVQPFAKTYIESPIIVHPESGRTYCIKNSYSVTGELDITIEGVVDKISNINLANLFYMHKDGVTYFNSDISTLMLPLEGLPKCDDFNQKKPSVLAYYNGNLTALRCLNLKFEDNQLETCKMAGNVLPDQEKYQNETMKEECQEIAGDDIRVITSPLPVVMAKNRPSLSVIEKLYKKFIKYNNDDKLKQQHEICEGYCHMQAHFVKTLLGQYGVHSTKVTKFWDPPSWESFDNRGWAFHCAVMITTAENKHVIVDPWEGFNKKLLTVHEWLFRENEPKPVGFLVSNKSIIFPTDAGKISYIPRLTDNVQLVSETLSRLQYLYEDALPNLPEKPLLKEEQPLKEKVLSLC